MTTRGPRWREPDLLRRPGWTVDGVDAATFAHLADTLAGSELQSLLLEIMRARARKRTPAELLAQYRRDRFVRPATIDLRVALELELHLLAAADQFDAVDLSPVAPLGVCSAIALTDQHRTLSATRATEVVSDPTNVLALECAERLRMSVTVHLATCQRVVRAQAFPSKPGFAAHFRIFTLASAGREQKDHGFSVEGLATHITTMHRALDRLEAHGYRFGARRLTLLARTDRTVVAERVRALVGGEVVPLDHAYYSGGVRYMLWVTNRDGEEVPIIDGGLFDWLAKLTSNERCVYVASGMGAQLAAVAFRETA